MSYSFKYDRGSVNDAIDYANSASSYTSEIRSKIASINELSNSVEINKLNFLNAKNIEEQLDKVDNLPSILVGLNEIALKNLMLEDNFSNTVLDWYNNKLITDVELIEISNKYMKVLMEEYGNDYINYLKKVEKPLEALKEAGMPENLVLNLNSIFCKALIDKDMMYTGEGVAYMGYTFTGLLAMFGLRLKYYEGGSFDRENDFYLGTSKEPLVALDCNNLYNWLCRCVGIDVHAGRAQDKYNYGIDEFTDNSQIQASSDSDYFTQGKSGDILNTDSHMLIILENTGDGYKYIEESGFLKIGYLTYDELKGYKLTNMDALYRNTSAYGKSPGRYGTVYNNFIPPDVIDKNISKLSAADIEKMNEQYSKRSLFGLSNEEIVNIINQGESEIQYENIPNIPNQTKPSDTIDLDSIQDKADINAEHTISNQGDLVIEDLNSQNNINEDNTNASINTTNNNNKTHTSNYTNTEINNNISQNISDNSNAIPKVNILPENKFSEILPSLSDGILNTMEISNEHVQYQISNIDDTSYNAYINKLEEAGFTLSGNNEWVKDGYKIVAVKDNSNILTLSVYKEISSSAETPITI